MLKSLRKKWAVYGIGYYHVLRYSPAVENDKLLIIHFDHLGDVCTLIPAVYPLTASYRITVVCRQGLEAVWKEFLPMVEAIPLSNSGWSAKKLKKEQSIVFSKIFGTVIVATITPYSAFYSSLVHAGKRIGLIENGRYFKGARILYDAVYDATVNEHVRYRFPRLFGKATGMHIVPENPPVDTCIRKSSAILIHPGGKWKPRRWPIERFVSVARQAVDRWDVTCTFLVHESETDLRDYIENQADLKGIILCLTRDASDLLEAVRSCGIFLGNDSGPVHLANLMKKETVLLWGPGNYNRIHPYGENNDILIKEIDCRPCRQYQDEERCLRGENACLKSISVDEVLAALEKKIEKIRL
jgi:ADP-heptose:LPS heptosyltransferase